MGWEWPRTVTAPRPPRRRSGERKVLGKLAWYHPPSRSGPRAYISSLTRPAGPDPNGDCRNAQTLRTVVSARHGRRSDRGGYRPTSRDGGPPPVREPSVRELWPHDPSPHPSLGPPQLPGRRGSLPESPDVRSVAGLTRSRRPRPPRWTSPSLCPRDRDRSEETRLPAHRRLQVGSGCGRERVASKCTAVGTPGRRSRWAAPPRRRRPRSGPRAKGRPRSRSP